MIKCLLKKLLIIYFLFLPTLSLAEAIDDPCGGSNELLSLVNRPSYADSACTVPFKKFIMEMGYQYLNLTSGGGHAQTFPLLELRLGLPFDNEVVMLVPTYYVQSTYPKTGSGPMFLGLKHKLAFTEKWVATIEGIATLPSGSAGFGSANYGGEFNGIFTYNFTSQLTLTLMAGVSSQTLPSLFGGTRFSSFNPDIVLSYLINEKTSLYGEVFGQTNAGPHLGSGYNFDGGILYLPRQNIEVDFSIGQRLSGQFGFFNNYIAVGTSFLFG